MRNSPATPTRNRPPGQPKTPAVACCWLWAPDCPLPVANLIASTASTTYTTALPRDLTVFPSAFFLAWPDADQPNRQRSTSAACQTASASSPTAMIHSSGLPTGDCATVAIAPDGSASPPPPPHASCSPSHATSTCTSPYASKPT